MKKTLTSCYVYLLAFHAITSHGFDSLSERYVALAIQGQLEPARELLSEAEINGWPAEQDLARRFRARFIDQTEPLAPGSGSPLVDEIVSAYRAYWIEALIHGSAQVDGTPHLESAVRTSLRSHGWQLPVGADANELQRVLVDAIRAEGFYALPGRASPLQDLLLWSKQSESRHQVVLTDQRREVSVLFLSEFISRGWKHYAALGLVTTSGWIEDGILHCVDQAYDPGTESFEVSYLKHESRHLADMEQFPGLPAVDLEYRAKLTELAFARATLRGLLEEFTSRSASNPEAPHAEANHRVTHDLYAELYGRRFPGNGDTWMTLNTKRVNAAARRLLKRDSMARLEAQEQPGHLPQ